MSENNVNMIDTNIALWGISGTGKTWLTHAFAKELRWYTEKDPTFSYSLTDYEDNRIFVSVLDSENVGATSVSEDHLWKFQRRVKGGVKTNRSLQVSSHEHQIIIHDNKGGDLQEIVAGYGTNQEIVKSTLTSSSNLIVLLDPTMVTGSPFAADETENYSKSEYGQWIERLVEIILEKKKSINIALCLSKADLVQLHLPTEEIIKVVFGTEVLGALENSQVESKLFKVSSVGTVRNEKTGKKESNLEEGMEVATHKIKNPSEWNPLNVASPFFWLFEKVERQRIRQNDIFGEREKHYISYPPPRI